MNTQRLAIENLQRYLRAVSSLEESVPSPPIDGVFESDTENSLRAYQRWRGFEETGRADLATWEQLYADYLAVLAAQAPTRTVPFFPASPYDYTLRVGSKGFAVSVLQYMLYELHTGFLPLHTVEITGVYDAETEKAVRLLQARLGLIPNGQTDRLTWNAIVDLYEAEYYRSDN